MKSNIKHMVFICLLISFLCSCNESKVQHAIFQIELDSNNYGWYFIELHSDSLTKDSIDVYIKFDSTSKFTRATVDNYDRFDYKAIDRSKNEISNRMKLSGVLLHHSGRRFFKFYNPTEKELSEIKTWLPTDPNYFKIYDQANKQLDTLLKKS